VVASLLEARIAEGRSRVVLPVAALTTIREAVSAHSAIGCAHEGFVLIERDFVAAHQEPLADGEPALRQLIGIAKLVISARADNGGASGNHDHFGTVLAVARHFVPPRRGAPGHRDGQQEYCALHACNLTQARMPC
jgi:hypothetical protein